MTDKVVIDTMPSVTVCIPARNETHAMTECLERVIASSYPKMEVIVLDDLSGDDTSTLIKAFAHEGVRFVEGTALKDGWLGKNHALEGLLKESSGTYVLFMDVDTRIQPDTIEQLVAYAQHEKALMVSVLPRREDGWRASVLFSPLRYFWELMFHQTVSPASASNAWMIDRKTLLDRWKGFESFKTAIQPESRLAAELMKEKTYRFLLSTPLLGVSYEKKWRSQIDTSIRLLYPLLGARASHAVIAILDLLIIASPVAALLSSLLIGWQPIHIVFATLYVLLGVVYAMYARRVWKGGWQAVVVLWPAIILQEAVLIAISMIQYKKGSVTWKGRVVSLPKQTH